jgi:hypothetical protein
MLTDGPASGGRSLVVLLGSGVVLAVGAGIAIASIPDASGVIHACYKTSQGQTRIVQSAADCNPSETAIQWNQTGVAGARWRLLKGSDGSLFWARSRRSVEDHHYVTETWRTSGALPGPCG